MRDALAERLLATVMNWSPADVVHERPVLQVLALLKYDEYQKFSPGMRFVESLALWLAQFASNERQVAYDFIRSRLIFLSEAEMSHFATIMYPDLVRPVLLARAAAADGTSPHLISQIARGSTFRRLQSSTLFLGFSDGARVDQFRRSNRELSHEQIFPTYELHAERVKKVKERLKGRDSSALPVPAVVLLDDFAGSGSSYISEANGTLEGKLARFVQHVTSHSEWQDLVRFPDTALVVACYVATAQAVAHIRSFAPTLEQQFGAKLEILLVQLLNDRIRILPSSDEEFVQLIERYYDPEAEDEHTAKGRTDLKFGFAGCGLPLVLHHNTPNNSLFLLWAEDSESVFPLFRRFSRHRREP